jgi:hypothetical protein
MNKISVAAAALLLAGASTVALAQESGSQGGVQGGADGTSTATTGAPGANMQGGTGTPGTGPEDPASESAPGGGSTAAEERAEAESGIENLAPGQMAENEPLGSEDQPSSYQ